jgi:hypothetical protein
VGSSAVPGPVGRGLLGLASGGGATFSREVVDQAGLGSQPGPLLKDSGSLPGAGAWAGCGDPAEETGHLGLQVEPFTAEDALLATEIFARDHRRVLSLADRCCLATAIRLDLAS